MKTILKLDHVIKQFDKQIVLDDISFSVTEGQIVGFIGPSGAGKSIVIKILLGMEVADSGRATVFNQAMPNRQLLNKIGYMAQTDALYESLSAKENLQFYADMKGLSKSIAIDEINHVLKVVDLTANANKRVSGYSGGMKRRLSLAIALMGQNELLILDEPTVGIDPALRRKIWQELKK